jgi:hypothetical protein
MNTYILSLGARARRETFDLIEEKNNLKEQLYIMVNGEPLDSSDVSINVRVIGFKKQKKEVVYRLFLIFSAFSW